MPSSDDKKLAARAQAAAVFSSANPPPQSENLPCPRCDSTNTKFCYYNNYNLSQPRHFCKSCRRYWTQGGTLRNVPIGGGTRKNSKRSRNITNNANASTLTSSSSCSTDATNNNNNNNNSFNSVVKISESDGAIGNGSFTSLLSSQGNGFLGFEDLSGFNSVWPSYQEMNNCNATAGEFGYGGVNVNGSANAAEASVGNNNNNNAWQMSGVEQGSLVDGDCFAWPDLAISTTANGFK